MHNRRFSKKKKVVTLVFLKLNILILPKQIRKKYKLIRVNLKESKKQRQFVCNIFFGGNNSRKHHRQFQGSRESGF